MSGFNIPVTEEVIAKAVQRDSSHCMIADAIRAHVPGVSYVSVDLQTIRFTIQAKRKRYVFLTPRQGQLALINFDQGVKPESFTMRIQRPQVIDILERKPNRDSRVEREGIRSDSGIDKTPESKKGPGRPKGAKTKGGAKLKEIGAAAKGRPHKTGGQAPPTAVLSNSKGRIREFGLRSLTK